MILDYDKTQSLTEHFKMSEFHCKDGTAVPPEYISNCYYIAIQLERLRRYTGAIKINSAYRTPSHNSKIGGAKNSNHLTARAVDIIAVAGDYETFSKIIRAAIERKIIPDGEVIYYPDKKFVHYAPKFDYNFTKILKI